MEIDIFTLENLAGQIQKANEAGAKADAIEPRAVAVRFDAPSHRLILDLRGGLTFMFPPAQLAELKEATPAQQAKAEILPGGIGLHWEELDVDISVPGLLVDLLGTRSLLSEVGRRARGKTSEAKKAAARKNGKKGGRPKKRVFGD